MTTKPSTAQLAPALGPIHQRLVPFSFDWSCNSRIQCHILLEPIYLTAPIADPPPIPYNKLLLAQGKSPIWLKSSLTDILYFISHSLHISHILGHAPQKQLYNLSIYLLLIYLLLH